MEYYLRQDGKIDGPWGVDQIRRLIGAGKWALSAEAVEARGQTLFERRTATDWVNVSTVLDQTSARPEVSATSVDAQSSSPVVNRYRDAYRVGSALVGLGNVIKVVGAILAGIIVLVSLSSGDGPLGGAAVVAGIFIAAIVGVLFWVSGVVVAAQGQILLATLDNAVASSHFLTDLERADAMSLPRSVADRGAA